MKANELMIGDWVQIVSDAPIMANEYHRIDWIRTGEVGLDNRKIVTYPYIQPIPLTAEILEKNGFVNKKGRFMQKGNFDVPPLILWHLIDEKKFGHPKSQLEIHYGAKSMHVSLVCIYVHELQHALRLCGIEKEIEL